MFALLPLLFSMGCTDFEKNTLASLKTAESLYVLVYDATLDAKTDKLISQEDVNRIADMLDIYKGAFEAAKTSFELYRDNGKTDDLKANLQRSLSGILEKRVELMNAFIAIMEGIEGVKSWEELNQKSLSES